MKTISVINIKGGSGKTSAAVPLVVQASQQGSALLVDLDPSPSASRWINAAELASDTLKFAITTQNELQAELDQAESAGTRWCIIDTPSVMRDTAMSAMLVAELVLIPMHIGSGDMDNLVETVKLMNIPLRHRPDLKVRVLLNHTGNMPAVTRRTREAVEGFGLRVLAAEIPFRSVYAEAKGSAPVGDDYRRVWEELSAVLEEAGTEVRQ